MFRLIASQIVDFVIWSLFQRSKATSRRPSHVLCYGYQKASLPALQEPTDSGNTGIPGVISVHPNEPAKKFKCHPWTEILSLLGRSGDTIVRHLLLDCGVFIRTDQGKDNLHQVCGTPVSELLNDLKIVNQPSNVVGKLPTRERKNRLCDPRIRTEPHSLCSTIFECSRSRAFWDEKHTRTQPVL